MKAIKTKKRFYNYINYCNSCGWVLGLLIFISCRSADGVKKVERPNILFIFSDDQRGNTIHELGNQDVITPHLDELVRTGTAFTNTYIMGALNGAVCAPSRAMLMTGRGVFDVNPPEANQLDMPDTLMPRALAHNGYNTFHTGKWHNGHSAFQKAFDNGSKIFFGGMYDQYTVPTHEYNAEGIYNKATQVVENIHSSELYANAAIDFIKGYESQDPFMMYVAFQAPHDPRDVAEEYLNMYDTASIDLPPNFANEHPFDNGELDIRDEWLAGYPRTAAEVKANIIAYYAMITHMDEQIGKVLAALDDKGLRDNTIVIFSSDNGLAVGQHGLMGKQNLYEHSIKVPFIIQGPQIPSDQRIEELTYTTDIYPTICDVTNTSIPSTVEGRSIMPMLSGMSKESRQSMIYVYKNSQRAIRSGDYKLIKYMVDGIETSQLFNLQNDPWETMNLYSDSNYVSKVRDLEILLQKELLLEGDQVQLDEANWGVVPMKRWVHKVSQETIDWLRDLAEKEREMRGF